MSFKPSGEVVVRELEVGKDIFILVADLGVGKNTIKILDDLRSAVYRKNHKGVRNVLGEMNRAHVSEALIAIRHGDAKKLGAVYESAQAAFDAIGHEVCPSELIAPALHDALLSARRDVPHLIHGGKGVGSQGDGSLQFVCSSNDAMDELERYLTSYSNGRIDTFVRVYLRKNIFL